MSIIGTFPIIINNGDLEDATVVMQLFAFIQSQVNGAALAASGANNDITSLNALSTPLSTTQGGTGNTVGNAATASAAQGAFFGAGVGTASQFVVNASGQNPVYFYSNQTDFGIYSISGGSLVAYNRSSNSATFNGTATKAGNAIGFGQTYQDVAASRIVGGSYTNNTGRPIGVYITCYCTSGTALSLFVDGILLGFVSTSNTTPYMGGQLSAVVPPGSAYVVSGSGSASGWVELK